jgi:hypothetical protein
MAAYINEGAQLGNYPVKPYVPAQLSFDAWIASDDDAKLEADIVLWE